MPGMTSSSTDAQRRLPVALALGVVILVGAYVWFAVAMRFVTFAAVATAAYAVAFAVSGTLVWLRRPEYVTGRFMVLAGYLTLITPLQRLPESGALFAIGTSLKHVRRSASGSSTSGSRILAGIG